MPGIRRAFFSFPAAGSGTRKQGGKQIACADPGARSVPCRIVARRILAEAVSHGITQDQLVILMLDFADPAAHPIAQYLVRHLSSHFHYGRGALYPLAPAAQPVVHSDYATISQFFRLSNEAG